MSVNSKFSLVYREEEKILSELGSSEIRRINLDELCRKHSDKEDIIRVLRSDGKSRMESKLFCF
jgi:hypothetical protein